MSANPPAASRTADSEPEVKLSWQLFKDLYPYLRAFPLRVLVALALLVAAKLAAVGLPLLLKQIVDALDVEVGGQQLALMTPLFLVLAYGALRFANVLFGELRDLLFGKVTERAVRRIGLRVFEHLHRLDLAFHLQRRTGGLSRDIERGTTGIGFLLRFMLFNIVPSLLEMALVVGILLANYDVWFALITAASVLAYIGFSIVATEWRTEHVRQANHLDSQSNSRAIDSLLNYETVKYFGNETHEAQQLDATLEQWEQAKTRNRWSLLALNTGQSLIISVGVTALMALAAWQVQQGRMTLGDLVLVNAFIIQLFLPLNFLGFVYRELKGSLANIERMLGLLRIEPQVCDPQLAKTQPLPMVLIIELFRLG